MPPNFQAEAEAEFERKSHCDSGPCMWRCTENRPFSPRRGGRFDSLSVAGGDAGGDKLAAARPPAQLQLAPHDRT